MPNDIEPVGDDAQIELLRGLAHIVRDEGLTELSLEENGWRIALKSAVPDSAVATAAALTAASAEVAEKNKAGLTAIVSPMVGVFYRAPSPNDPSFVEVGDTVFVGQVVGVVEAMKVFNEIVSEVEGVVEDIPGPNGDLVETGQSLVVVRKGSS